MARVAASLVAGLGLVGCHVTNPRGYDQLTTAPHVEPLAPVQEGPLTWRMPDGGRVTIEMEPSWVHVGTRRFRADLAYSATFGTLTLHCATEPKGPGVPETRFGCWSDAEDVTFWVAPDTACPARHTAYRQTLRTPACWRGVLTTPTTKYTTAHAYITQRGHVIHRVSWLDETGTVQQAADLVVERRPRIFHATETDRALLSLHAVALQFWLDAIDLD